MSEFKVNISESRIEPKDEKIVNPSLVFVTFGQSPFDRVDFHVYDTDGNYITSVYDMKNALPSSPYSFNTVNGSTTFTTDPTDNLLKLGLMSGTYKIVYNFLTYYLAFEGVSNVLLNWYIQDISTSRTELRVVTPTNGIVGDANIITKAKLDAKRSLFELVDPNDVTKGYTPGSFVLDHGQNVFSLVTNQTVSGDALLFKLYEPLPDTISTKDSVTPLFEVARPVEVLTTLINEPTTEMPLKVLKGANTNVDIHNTYNAGTALESWNDLISTDPITSKNVLDHYLSSSNSEVTVNVDYTDYTNFVHFGSAEEMVRNFVYKLQLLEQYTNQSGQVSASVASGSLSVSQSLAQYDLLSRTVKNGFSGYENFLYYTSGSTFSSSLGYGQVTQSTWPKSNSTVPYILYSVTSSQGQLWFNNQVQVAQDYDNTNTHNLLRTVPFHIREDAENNQAYLTFVEMVGEHYDTLWTAIKGMTQRYDVKHKLDEGAAKDVIWETLRSFGMELTNGGDTNSLWKYAFGMDETGSFANNQFQLSSNDASKEIWKRIFNNLSYLLKSKGTVRGLRALLTTYGIPPTLLRIKEYGGPETTSSFEDSLYVSDEFTYAFNFDGQQQISASWDNFAGDLRPNSVELRFNITPAHRDVPRMLFEVYDAADTTFNFALSVTPISSSVSGTNFTYNRQDLSTQLSLAGKSISGIIDTSSADIGNQFYTASGYLQLDITDGITPKTYVTNEMPLYNGAYWSVLLERTQPTSSRGVKLWAKQAINGRIIHEATFSITIPSSPMLAWDTTDTFTVGSGSVVGRKPFIGEMQEFRLWSSTLNEDVFDNHVTAPLAYNGNTYSSSFYDLELRWRFNQAEFFISQSYFAEIVDSNPSQLFINNGLWKGPTSASSFVAQQETNHYLSPDIAFRRMVSNKVRIDTNVSMTGNLSPTKRVTVSRFDTSPLDSNKIGVFLSPTEIINEDIIRSFAGGVTFDDLIGNPLDVYKENYADLQTVNNFYWSKFGTTPNIYTYLKALSYFDKSLYNIIRNMLPARVSANVGFLFEPHMLERNKVVVGRPPIVQDFTYSSSLDVFGQYELTSDTSPLTASLSNPVPSLFMDTMPVSMSLVITSFSSSVYLYNTLDFSSSISENKTTLIPRTFVWSPTASLVPPIDDFWNDSSSLEPNPPTGSIVSYSPSHYIFHRDRNSAMDNRNFIGCVQTITTTPDKGLPWESIAAPPNTLVVVDNGADKPRLKVT